MRTDPKPLNNPATRAGKIAYALVTLVLVGAFLAVFALNDNPEAFSGSSYSEWSTHYIDADQYALLADALLDGKTTLDLPVPDELAALDNPYDIAARMAITGPDVPIFWDHAFYEGHYYSYFGVVPALLVYAPYKLVTGTWLYTPNAIKFIGVLGIIALSLLVWRIGRRYFRDTATILSLSVCLFTLFVGCNFAYHAFVPRFYSVPIVSSLLFTALAFYFWMGAKLGEDNEPGLLVGPAAPAGGGDAACAGGVDQRDRLTSYRRAAVGVTPSCGRSRADKQAPHALSAWHLAAGSLCMALNLGCRPQFILASILAFAIFKDEIFKTRELFSRRGLAQTIAALLPFVLVFALLLGYNYVRFGSVFDFGSSYNLTGFDMTTYSPSRMLIIVLMLTYLFGPMAFSSEFPFIQMVSTDHPQWGWAPNEPFYGGFFLLMPVQILALLFPFVRKPLKERGLFGFVIVCLALAVTILLADTYIAGITQRYFSDFGLYIALSACLALLGFQARGFQSTSLRTVTIALIALAVVFTVVVGAFSLFSPDRYDAVAFNNPDLYNAVAALFS